MTKNIYERLKTGEPVDMMKDEDYSNIIAGNGQMSEIVFQNQQYRT